MKARITRDRGQDRAAAPTAHVFYQLPPPGKAGRHFFPFSQLIASSAGPEKCGIQQHYRFTLMFNSEHALFLFTIILCLSVSTLWHSAFFFPASFFQGTISAFPVKPSAFHYWPQDKTLTYSHHFTSLA